MNSYFCYEWQRISKDQDRDFDGSKNLKDLIINNNLTDTLKFFEIMLNCTKVINDELVDEHYAEIEDNDLSNLFFGSGKPVPKKYLKEFEKIKNEKK